MIRAIAALALASASTQPSTATSAQPLASNASWWERVTVSVTDDGKAQGCKYETNLGGGKSSDCSVSGDQASATKASASAGSKDKITRITFERRFTPAAMPVTPSMQPGDLLLGGAVMALAIDGKGAVEHCKVVSTSGSVTPQYGCDEASAERFDASAATDPHLRAPAREGYMTILVYGHSEHVV